MTFFVGGVIPNIFLIQSNCLVSHKQGKGVEHLTMMTKSLVLVASILEGFPIICGQVITKVL